MEIEDLWGMAEGVLPVGMLLKITMTCHTTSARAREFNLLSVDC